MLFCVKTIITDFQTCRSDGQEVKVEAAEKVEFEKHRSIRRLSPIYHPVPSPGKLFQMKLKSKITRIFLHQLSHLAVSGCWKLTDGGMAMLVSFSSVLPE